MLTKTTLIVLSIIIGVAWHARLTNAEPFGRPVLINRCAPDYSEPACYRRDRPEKPQHSPMCCVEPQSFLN